MKKEGPDGGQETTGATVVAMTAATVVVMVGRGDSSAEEERRVGGGGGGTTRPKQLKTNARIKTVARSPPSRSKDKAWGLHSLLDCKME
jgi:hypothetical protein